MLNDLDKTLKTLLTRELPADLVGEEATTKVTISFTTPDKESAANAIKPPAINFFLYDIRENMELRSNERRLEQRDGLFIQHPPPVRVDCSYLITAWSASADKATGDEHWLLSEVLQVLLRYRQLPVEVLQGKLKAQEPPVRAKILQPSYLNSMGEFWQAMGDRPRATLHYTVTISIPVGQPRELEAVIGLDIRLQPQAS